jgi:hypothetical protein
MTGKHRRPRRSTGRNLAATAAVLTAGALPVAAAASAFADAAPAAGSPPAATLPLSSVADGLDGAAVPLQGTLPLATTATADVTGSVAQGDLPVGGLLGAASPQSQARASQMDQQAAFETAAVASDASRLTGRITAQPEVSGLLAQAAPNTFGTGANGGTVDGFAGRLGTRATQATDRVVSGMSPVVGQLRTQGVPTVGDVTSTLSQTKMPVFGTVGGLTSVVPASEMLGDGSPMLDTIGSASKL